MSNEIEQSVQRLAYIAALKKHLNTLESQERSVLLDAKKRRSEYPTDDYGNEIASVVVKYVDSEPKPGVSIDDEAQVLPWLLDVYGEKEFNALISTGLTAAGRAEVTAYARKQYAKNGSVDLPGMTVTDPPAKKLTVAVTPQKNIVDLVQGMVRRGAINFNDLLSIEGGQA